MIKIGLSGNRYSGKSLVANLFKDIGIPVFDADTILCFILNYNWELLAKIKQELGADIFQGDYLNFREIKKPEVFNNILNIVEPDILAAYDKFNRKQNSIYTIFHSSILFEKKWNLNMDQTVCVNSSNKDRMARCKKLTNLGLLIINDLSKSEMDTLEKSRFSDYTVHNYNEEITALGDTFKQVCKIDQKIIDTYLFSEATKRII